jgi:hypothetical protein
MSQRTKPILDDAEWLILDNLKQGWRFGANLTQEMAAAAMRRCVDRGLVIEGQLTSEGQVALLLNPIPSNPVAEKDEK